MTEIPARSAAFVPLNCDDARHQLENVAFVRPGRIHAAEQFDQRAFAGTILAAQRVYFAGTEVEADATQRRDVAETLDEIGRLGGWAESRSWLIF